MADRAWCRRECQAPDLGLQPHCLAHGGRKRAIEIARMLLDAGGDPDIRDDKYDSTVLGWAEFCGHEEVAQLVRARGGRK
jgi:ankyrin repeat protein